MEAKQVTFWTIWGMLAELTVVLQEIKAEVDEINVELEEHRGCCPLSPRV